MATLQNGYQDVDSLGSVLSPDMDELGAQLVEMTILDVATAASDLDTWLRVARPEDDRITEDADATGRLVGACGGLPLTLQITVALLRADPALSAGELADELGGARQRLRGMPDGDGAGPQAADAVAVLELAYRKLPESAARMFRLLPVHPGPDISAATVEVLADRPASEMRRALATLVQTRLAEAAPGSVGRWRMHHLVSLYARHLSGVWAQADRREQAWDRLLDYYLSMAEAADDHVRGRLDPADPMAFATLDDALGWLDAERLSLIAAVEMAAGTGRDYAAASLPLHMAQYLARRRLFDDLLTITTIGLSAALRLGDRDLQGNALTNLGLAQQKLGQAEKAIATQNDAIAIFRTAGNLSGVGDALNNLGLALREERRLEEALTAHRDAAMAYRQVGDRHGEAGALNNLGLALKRVRCLAEAVTSHEDAAAIYRETSDRHGEGMAVGNLGGALRESGRPSDAIRAWRGAAAIFEETGDQGARGIALSNLGGVLVEVGRAEEAAIAYREAASVFRETGDLEREDIALAHLEATSD